MDFISGFLGLCSAVGTGTATEIAATGYARQPIAFGAPVNGVSASTIPFNFGPVGVSQIAGRAVFDAPTGGSLLLVLPHATPRPPPGGGAIDRGSAGYLVMMLATLAAYPDGGAFNGTFSAGAALGQVYDADDIIGIVSTQPNAVSGVTVYPTRGQFLQVRASTLTAGVALTVLRGLLHA